jgi:hypothetical protein
MGIASYLAGDVPCLTVAAAARHDGSPLDVPPRVTRFRSRDTRFPTPQVSPCDDAVLVAEPSREGLGQLVCLARCWLVPCSQAQPRTVGTRGNEGGNTATPLLTEEKAKAATQAYADKYLNGFTVEKVLPFTGMQGSMYSVEMKGPNEEVRLSRQPWGNVIPFGGPWRRTG